MTEQWRAIEDFPDYEVSDQGRVRRATPGGNNTWVGRILTPSMGGNSGYPHVQLHRNGRQHGHTVHSLVATAFIGPRPPGHQINHKNGIKTDNCVENLEYVTPQENVDHAVSLGLWTPECGSILTNEQVLAMRDAYRGGKKTCREIGEEYGVNRGTAMQVISGLSWKHLPGAVQRNGDSNLVRGERHPFHKLTEDAVRAIRARRQQGETQRALGREFGVGQSTISNIVHRRTWKHVD